MRFAIYGVTGLFLAAVLGFVGWTVHHKLSEVRGGGQVTAPRPRKLDARAPLQVPLACLNRVDKRTRQSFDRYRAWLDLGRGPTCQEPGLVAPHELYPDGASRCRDAATLARGFGARAYADALATVAERYAALFDTVQAAKAYYDGRVYEQDGCARGRALHPELVAGYQQTLEAIDAARSQTGGFAALINGVLRERLRLEHGRLSPQVKMLELAESLDALAHLFLDHEIDASELAAFAKASHEVTMRSIALDRASRTGPGAKWSRPQQKLADAADKLVPRLRRVKVRLQNQTEINASEWQGIERDVRTALRAARDLDFAPRPAVMYAD